MRTAAVVALVVVVGVLFVYPGLVIVACNWAFGLLRRLDRPE